MKKLLLVLILLLPQWLSARDHSDLIKENIFQSEKVKFYQETNAGHYLLQAGKFYQAGITLTIIGGGLGVLGASNSDGATTVIGGVAAVAGLIFTIAGHDKLIKAGYSLKKELALKPASQGLGLALVF